MIIRHVPRKHLPLPIRTTKCQILSSYLGTRTPGAAKLRNRIAKRRCDPLPPLIPPSWPLFNNNPCQRFLAKIIRAHLPVPAAAAANSAAARGRAGTHVRF